MTGKVWLVGAGPGDPGLFTVKGKKVLEAGKYLIWAGASCMDEQVTAEIEL